MARSSVDTRRPFRLVPFDQEAAVKADWQGCLSSIVLQFLVVVLRKLEGQVFSPVSYVSWMAHLTPLVAGWAMGSQWYAANRNLPILATRILTMHYFAAFGLMQGLFMPLSWPAFAYWLAMATQAVSQLWLVFAYPLPLGLHLTAVLVTAVEYLLRVPSVCSSPLLSHSCAMAAPSAAPASAAACAAAGGKFEAVADILDWPLA
ncbi:hypothetical protein N2152v2_006453 [Parachlorella kessleri]